MQSGWRVTRKSHFLFSAHWSSSWLLSEQNHRKTKPYQNFTPVLLRKKEPVYRFEGQSKQAREPDQLDKIRQSRWGFDILNYGVCGTDWDQLPDVDYNLSLRRFSCLDSQWQLFLSRKVKDLEHPVNFQQRFPDAFYVESLYLVQISRHSTFPV